LSEGGGECPIQGVLDRRTGFELQNRCREETQAIVHVTGIAEQGSVLLLVFSCRFLSGAGGSCSGHRA
jgi:hypothetical protein